jgi:hypothetical protein
MLFHSGTENTETAKVMFWNAKMAMMVIHDVVGQNATGRNTYLLEEEAKAGIWSGVESGKEIDVPLDLDLALSQVEF